MTLHKAPDNSIHDDMDGTALHLIPAGCVQITDAEADDLRKPTMEQLAGIACAQRVPLLDDADRAINKAEDNGLDSKVLRQYRQALRDITGQSGFPEKVKWPKVPM